MNENDYDRLQYSVLLFTFIIIAQFVLIVWYFSIPVGWGFIIFILSLGIIGFFLALFLQYKKIVYIYEMKKYLSIEIKVSDKKIKRR
jgi:uncharacterized membrane protein YczE